MRLTLRALLAYLYNVLEPADAREFSTKVQESAVASGLVQRIGAITKKMRMNAPRIDAKGMADDANNVAEYLDNSLSEEQVGDFERACINSDQHLAEVASSYQILTMVLGKAADVPESMQTRIYRLPLDLATTHKDSSGDGEQRKRLKKTIEKVAQSARETDAGMQSVRSGSTHSVAEVPDYLRSKQGNLAKWLAFGAVILVIALIAITAAGPLDSTNGVIGWMFKPPAELADANQSDQTDDQSIAADSAAEDANAKRNDGSANDQTSVAVDSGDDSDKAGNKNDTAENTANKAVSDSAEASPGPPVPPEPPVESEPATSATSSDAKATTKTGEKVADASETKPAAAVGPMDVGRYVSDDQVLTRFDAKSGLWFLVPPRAILAAGERLVVLPTYRPQIALASGVQVTFAGESEVQANEPQSPTASRLSIDYGRFVIVTLGNAGAQLELEFGGVQGTLTLEDSNTVVAIDARHFLPPGSSPEKDERTAVIEIYAVDGKIRWEETGLDPLEIPPQHVLTYVAGQERELAGPFEVPEWIDAGNLSQIDRFTSPVLQRELLLEKPVHVRLQELMSDRRAEVRSLAARCLAQYGEFEPLLRELASAQQKSFWGAEVELLRQSLTRGTETADQIRRSLDSLYPEDADTLFRILWGFSPEQLDAGAAKELVEFLDSPEMAVRVVAIDTLRQITDAQLLYRPERAPNENRASIVRWTEREKEGGITYKRSPSPIGERKPPSAAPAEETKAPAAKTKEE
jgi:hypothetical protein